MFSLRMWVLSLGRVSVWLTHDIELHRVGGGVALRVESLTLVLPTGHPLNLLQDEALLGQDNPLLLVADQLFPLKWYLSLSRRVWLFWLSWRFTIKSQSVVIFDISLSLTATQYLVLSCQTLFCSSQDTQIGGKYPE